MMTTSQPSIRRPLILDTTLREGQQHPNVHFSPSQGAELVTLLEGCKVDVIEVGHPSVSPEAFAACKAAADAASSAEILMHSRADPREVHAVARAGADWVGVWAAFNDIGLAAKFPGCSRPDIERKVSSAVSAARAEGLNVRFTIEDASRTSLDHIRRIATVARAAGATRISLADTVGVMHPARWAEPIEIVKHECGCEIQVHCHNDLGLALANTLAAYDAGADVLDASLLGLGERAGITDLAQLALVMTLHYGHCHLDLLKVSNAAHLTAAMVGLTPEPHRPIVGRHVFTHQSHYHARAVGRDAAAYEGYPPEMVGRARTVTPPAARSQTDRPTQTIPAVPIAGETR